MAYPSAIVSLPEREQQPYDPAVVVRHLAQELRQPLGNVESIAHYLNMVLPRTEANARRQLAKLRSEVRQVHWILADTLHFLQAAPLHLELLDPAEILHRELPDGTPEDRAGINFVIEPNLPLVRLDLEQMQHLLRNVTAFLGRVSGPGKSIHLRAYAADGEVVFEVRSDALEFSLEDLEPLFEPFTGELPAGTGLGLASVRRIAEAQGGRVEAISDPPNRLTLVIAFPAA